MTALFLVALLPLFGATADSVCTTTSCTIVNDETSLLQTRSSVDKEHNAERRPRSKAKLTTADQEKVVGSELAEETPPKGHRLNKIPESLAKQLSSLTFVATVGKNKWLFWFKHALKNAQEKTALKDADDANLLGTDIYAGGGRSPWMFTRNNGAWLPNAWQQYRTGSWQDAALQGVLNGQRWANIGRSVDWANYGSFPSWRNDWEIAAALPLDPLDDDELWPGVDDVASTEAYIDSKWNDDANIVDAAAVEAGADATAYADSAYTDAWLANKAMDADAAWNGLP